MGITAQRTRTWKWSTDPLFEAKKAWVLAAYKAAEAGTLDGVRGVLRRVRADLTETPRWVRAGSRRADRAGSGPPTTATRGPKVHGCLRRRRRPTVGPAREARRVTGQVILEFLEDIRRRYPAETTVYIVMDNLSAHWTPAIRRWAVANNVGLLPTPTNASHLNRIECHFWAYVEFVINGSDYADWTAVLQSQPGLHPPPQPRAQKNDRMDDDTLSYIEITRDSRAGTPTSPPDRRGTSWPTSCSPGRDVHLRSGRRPRARVHRCRPARLRAASDGAVLLLRVPAGELGRDGIGPTTATGRAYALEVGVDRASGDWIEVYGAYDDAYVHDGRWMFSRRAFRTLAHRTGGETRLPTIGR